MLFFLQVEDSPVITKTKQANSPAPAGHKVRGEVGKFDQGGWMAVLVFLSGILFVAGIDLYSLIMAMLGR